MNDGRTRQGKSINPNWTPSFLENHLASLTILRGPNAGSEFALKGSRVIAGRSSAAAIRIDEESISSEHAAFELAANGFGVRDLASTNGIRVNGAETNSVDLEHGDRIQLGDCELQYVVEDRPKAQRTWSLEDDA